MQVSDRIALAGVSTTALATLYSHARSSRAGRPLLSDPESERLWQALVPELEDSDHPMVRRLLRGHVPRMLVNYVVLRARWLDATVHAFLRRHPGGVVVSLGCGLDPRFSRCDDGQVRFFDLDLPELIALKRRWIAESERYRMLGCSVLDPGWLEDVGRHRGEPMLFLAEGLFMYLPAEEVRQLVLRLQQRFPGSELACELFSQAWLTSPLGSWVQFKLWRMLGPEVRFLSGFSGIRAPEGWGPGIRLQDSWSFLDEGWPELGGWKLLGKLEAMRRLQWIGHYHLGETPPTLPS
jgi:O-methyltransferase involved in polyketide biosynthesis